MIVIIIIKICFPLCGVRDIMSPSCLMLRNGKQTREEHPQPQPLVAVVRGVRWEEKSFSKSTVKIRTELHIKRLLAGHCQTKPMRDKQVCFIRVRLPAAA